MSEWVIARDFPGKSGRVRSYYDGELGWHPIASDLTFLRGGKFYVPTSSIRIYPTAPNAKARQVGGYVIRLDEAISDEGYQRGRFASAQEARKS